MRAIRKILKKLSKHVPPSAPMPGYIALEIDHPHEPEKRILSVRALPLALRAVSSATASSMSQLLTVVGGHVKEQT